MGAKAKVLVVGSGHFGTALAQHLALLGHGVFLWSRDASLAESIQERGSNPKYFPGVPLNSGIQAFWDLSLLNEGEEPWTAWVLAVPTQALRKVALDLQPYYPRGLPLISTSKGLERSSGCFPSGILKELLGEDVVSLAGPSFAVEILKGLPTAVEVASSCPGKSAFVQRLFQSPTFKVSICQDPLGLELAGAVKNVMALAAGFFQGSGYGANALAALITGALGELSVLGKAMGASQESLLGLAGLGDLILTCSSKESRNYKVGWALAQGDSLELILKELGSVAEGVSTLEFLWKLLQEKELALPMVQALMALVHGKLSREEALALLWRGICP